METCMGKEWLTLFFGSSQIMKYYLQQSYKNSCFLCSLAMFIKNTNPQVTVSESTVMDSALLLMNQGRVPQHRLKPDYFNQYGIDDKTLGLQLLQKNKLIHIPYFTPAIENKANVEEFASRLNTLPIGSSAILGLTRYAQGHSVLYTKTPEGPILLDPADPTFCSMLENVPEPLKIHKKGPYEYYPRLIPEIVNINGKCKLLDRQSTVGSIIVLPHQKI